MSYSVKGLRYRAATTKYSITFFSFGLFHFSQFQRPDNPTNIRTHPQHRANPHFKKNPLCSVFIWRGKHPIATHFSCNMPKADLEIAAFQGTQCTRPVIYFTLLAPSGGTGCCLWFFWGGTHLFLNSRSTLRLARRGSRPPMATIVDRPAAQNPLSRSNSVATSLRASFPGRQSPAPTSCQRAQQCSAHSASVFCSASSTAARDPAAAHCELFKALLGGGRARPGTQRSWLREHMLALPV